MLKENLLFGVVNKIDSAIERLKYFEPSRGYYLAFSGGKDSICIKELADLANVKYDAHYNVTTIDPPELILFIRQYYPDVVFEMPEEPFLKRMTKRGFPQRRRRWCCEEYKERGGEGRFVITGVRREESGGRRYRPIVHHCYKNAYIKKGKMVLNPIIDWMERDVWEFIKKRNLNYCKLYDEGWKRIGCLFCPMAGKHRIEEVKLYPKYVELFIKAFEKLYENKKATGKISVNRWKNGEEMFWWWINENREKENPNQYWMFE